MFKNVFVSIKQNNQSRYLLVKCLQDEGLKCYSFPLVTTLLHQTYPGLTLDGCWQPQGYIGHLAHAMIFDQPLMGPLEIQDPFNIIKFN